jgi:muramidase (phage lysozyme)
MADVDKSNADWLKTVPEGDREQWRARLAASRAQISVQALRTEFQTYDGFQTTKLTGAQDQFLRGIDQTPEALQAYIKSNDELVDQTNWADGVKAQKKAEFAQNATKAYALARTKQDPQGTAEALGAPRNIPAPAAALLNTIAGTESPDYNVIHGGARFNSYADHPRVPVLITYGPHKGKTSDAAGRYQFLSRTWDEAKRALNLPDFSPASQDKAAWWLAQRDYRTNTGRDLNADLASGDISKVRSGLSPTWEGLQKINDAQFSERIGKGGSVTPRTPDPNLVGLSYADTLRFRDAATQAAARQQNAATAQQTEQYNNWWNQFQTDLFDGKIGREAITAARADNRLTDITDIVKANSIVDKREAQGVSFNAFTAKSDTPGAVWNPYDKADKDAVAAGVAQMGNTPQAAFDVWNKTGILAEAGSVTMRGGLVSTDPQRVLASATIAGNMLTRNPNAFAGVTGGNELASAGVTFNHLVNERGLTPEEAAKRIARENDPEYRSKIKVTEDAVKTFQADLFKTDQTSAIIDQFDPPGLFNTPKAPFDPGQRRALLNDFVEAAADRFKERGDPDEAKAFAFAELKKNWGVSRGMMVKFPPEKAYPPSGSPTAPHDYIYQQAAADVKTTAGRDVKHEDIFLLPLTGGQTAEAYRSGKPAPYQLWYRSVDPATKQVTYDTVPGKAFVADPKPVQAAVSEQRRVQLEQENAENRWNTWNNMEQSRALQQRSFDAYQASLKARGLPPAQAPVVPPMPPKPPKPPGMPSSTLERLLGPGAGPGREPPDPATFSDPMTGWSP